jgi:hypothetical protein
MLAEQYIYIYTLPHIVSQLFTAGRVSSYRWISSGGGSKKHAFVLYREQLKILLVNFKLTDAHHQRHYIGKLGKN